MIKVNAIGDVCPTPVIKTKKAIDSLTKADVVEVLVDNETAFENVQKFGKEAGGSVSAEVLGEKEYKIVIDMKNIDHKEEKKAENNTIVVIDSDVMGTGNDELGKVLIKGFVYAVSQLENLPNKILFYNGGATLTCEGSDALEDLHFMAENGVEILTCGTCLDYYHIKDKLAVGSVTNMYTIVEAMDQADKIIKP
ncbi:MAG TPA: sulfurtransferase-like selenium metabolism protein YedF [Candidatus Dorea intestinavium]|nr:sulfurtransferase-like selenium metabolism protein YedF [Candidatus Dorea intestinavium]